MKQTNEILELDETEEIKERLTDTAVLQTVKRIVAEQIRTAEKGLNKGIEKTDADYAGDAKVSFKDANGQRKEIIVPAEEKKSYVLFNPDRLLSGSPQRAEVYAKAYITRRIKAGIRSANKQ